MNVCEYANEIAKNISKLGGDPSVVFSSSVSGAVVKCFQIMNEYANKRRLKNVPTPFAIIGKNNDCDCRLENNNNYASLKFSDLNLDIMTLNKIIMDLGFSDQVNIEQYSTCINIEICTPVLVNNVE